MLWRWWLGRNNLNAEGEKLSVEDTWRQTNYWVTECALFCQKPNGVVSDRATPSRWTRPPGDKIKLNIDGSFQPEEKCGGWGFIARDGQGVVCGAGAGFLLHMLAARFNQKLMHVGKL